MDSVDDIFLKAREIADEVERAAYVDGACGGDATLRGKVEAMLRDAAEAEKYFGLETAAGLTEQVGTIIGRYKLLEKIGEGGMGVVYMAEQREPVIRKVALKIIKLGMDTRQVVGRFEAERQALALMQHPNIAKVLDGGTTESGRPYFVMELVQGLPITQFCDEASLPTAERLKLFLEVCSAVQHAHQKGVIHRDLKPSNILVTYYGDRPVPKVIDFGVAKATQGRLTDKTVFTQFQQFIGTPAYMSPEQTSLSGLDVDTRSDIYALGVLLYELLTGKTPFDPKELLKAGLEEMRQIIREQEPPKPSTRLSTLEGNDLTTTARQRHTDPPKLVHLVRGDLDWIVMKCLEKERARRYETANGLAMDLQRHLKNEPVAARPPSSWYSIQKAVRRNKGAFTAATVISVVLILASIVSTWQAIRATRAEQEAKKQASIARTVKAFVTDELLVPMDPAMNLNYDAKKAAIVGRAANALQGQFTNQPLIEAEIRFSLGKAFNSANDYTNAISQLELARGIFSRLCGVANSNTLSTAINLAEAYYAVDRRQEAIAVLTDAIAAGRTAPDLALALAGALGLRGQLAAQQGWPESTNDLAEALQIYTRNLPADDARITEAQFSFAQAIANMGNRLEAEKLCVDGISRCMTFYGPDNASTGYFLKLHGRILLQQTRYREAVRDFELAWTNSLRSAGTNQSNTLEAEDFLAQAYSGMQWTNEASQLFADVSRRWLKLVPYRIARDRCYGIASWFARHGQPEQGLTLMTDLKAALAKHPANSEWEFGALTWVESAAKGWPAAAEFCRAQFENFTNSPNAWRWKAVVFSYVGDDEWYRKAASRAIALIPAATNWSDRMHILQAAARGNFQFSAEQLTQCEAFIDGIMRALPTAIPSQKQQALRSIAAFEFRLGRNQQALEHLNEAWDIGPREVDRSGTLFLKSLCLHALGRSEEAAGVFREGEAEMSKWLPEPISAYEGFLNEPERYCLMLHRQARTLIEGAK